MSPWRGVSARGWVIGAVAGLVLAALAWQGWQLHRARDRGDRAAMAADTLKAALDTSRQLNAAQLAALRKTLGDSLAGATRLVVQLRQESDALDRALGQTRTANAQLTATVTRLTATVHSTGPVTVDTLGVRRASFRLRQAPYTIAATAELPAPSMSSPGLSVAPPAAGTLSVDVALDPATIGLRLGCTTSRENGVRSAVATATGPTWLQLAVGRVEQSPDVCNPPPATVARLSWWRRCAPSVMAGYGAVLAADGKAYHGPTVAGAIDVLRCLR